MKVSELEGADLDYWVAKALGFNGVTIEEDDIVQSECPDEAMAFDTHVYSRSWSQGGQIIEREKITLHPGPDGWGAWIHPAIHDPKSWSMPMADGPTPLVAAMRCFVASKFGKEVPTEERVIYRTSTTTDPESKKVEDAMLERSMRKPRTFSEIAAEVLNRAFENDKDKMP